ncbi:undecaprenyl-diphosphate phosphatase [soil metagenome]
MTLLDAAILGLVEGITEFLPVSSTGHLIIASHLLGLDGAQDKAALDAFTIVLQGGTILAVAGIYWPRIVQMLRGLMGKDAAGLRLLGLLVLAFLPAAVLGVLLSSWLEKHLFFPAPVIAAVALGGVFMLALEQWRTGRFGPPRPAYAHRTLDDLTARQALFIGFMQCIAMWPGVSRSLMGIAGGVIVGLKPRDAAEFAFLLGLPTLGGATVFKLFKNLRGPADENMFHVFSAGAIAVGVGVAFISALLAVEWLIAFLRRHGLSIFGWYRLALAAGLLLAAWQGWISIAPK